jgi:EAL domain-containing protein (putative c-di-GMP-specific phosphodiesterase class I)
VTAKLERQSILAVAEQRWRAILADPDVVGRTAIEFRDAASAVTVLATEPGRIAAVAIEPGICGTWMETLVDLTRGDTALPIPLFLLDAENDDPKALRASFARARLQTRAPEVSRPVPPITHARMIGLRYQPIIRLDTRKPVTAEVLARVVDDDGIVSGPQSLIDQMVDEARSMALTDLVLRQGARDAARGTLRGLGISFAFNLPLELVTSPAVIARFDGVRAIANVTARSISFELTETRQVHDVAALHAGLCRLADAGYRVAIDDVTPDMPNLPALLALPFRAVKLDRSVVAGARNDKALADFIRGLVPKPGEMRRAVIAEGVEDQEMLDLMASLGVTHGQGFAIARPLPAPALKPWAAWWAEHGVSEARG